ncbi:hypothetical protein HBH77_198970 [Parastagonospora nodorum]|nr:hypothetical protein HBH77_198970 [Parastagonospora nodorum]
MMHNRRANPVTRKTKSRRRITYMVSVRSLGYRFYPPPPRLQAQTTQTIDATTISAVSSWLLYRGVITMSDFKATRGKGSKGKPTQAVVESPSSPIESSPLSTPISDEGLDAIEASQIVGAHTLAREDVRGVLNGGTSGLAGSHAVHADEESSGDDFEPSFACPDCDKTYTSARSLKRHVTDKKTVCYKDRENDDGTRWSCPRCQAHMSIKFSVIRHIRDTCWKVCDECCEANSGGCDGHNVAGNCASCEQAGKSCTKHKGPITDCVPMLIIGSPVKPADAISRAKPAPASRAKGRKRKAVISPSGSPEPKPRAKRGARGAKKGQSVFSTAPTKVEEQTDIEGTQNPMTGNVRDRFPLPPSTDFLRHSRVPSGSTVKHPEDQAAQNILAPGPQGSGIHPPLLGRTQLGMPAVTPYSQQSTHEMIQRQVRAARNMNLGLQYPSSHGNGMAYPVSAGSDMRTSVNLGQDGWAPTQSHSSAQNSGRPSLPFVVTDNFAPRPGFQMPNINTAGLDVPSREEMTFEDHMRLSAPGSRVSSRQPSVVDGGPSAPVSRNTSRRASRQSSGEHLRLSLNSSASGPAEGGGGNSNSEDMHRLIVKLPMPRELKHKLSFEPIAQAGHPGNPTIRLRIHSNTYDDHGTPIFSILTMRFHDFFGPRLEYYCAQRGKRYGTDWKFIFKYPAPMPLHPNREKFFDIKYNMKPAGCYDKDYPGCSMRDGDMLVVVTRRASSASDDNDAELGTQIECQRICIQNGETEIWQAPDINSEWYRNADADLANTRRQLAMYHNDLVQLRAMQAHRENTDTGLQAQNMQLKGEIEMLRQGRLPYAAAPPPQYSEQDQYARYGGHGNGLPQPHGLSGGYAQTRSGFPPGSVANFLQAQNIADARRRAAVSGAADQVGAEQEE